MNLLDRVVKKYIENALDNTKYAYPNTSIEEKPAEYPVFVPYRCPYLYAAFDRSKYNPYNKSTATQTIHSYLGVAAFSLRKPSKK
jgi:hypothetical protein